MIDREEFQVRLGYGPSNNALRVIWEFRMDLEDYEIKVDDSMHILLGWGVDLILGVA